jgi:uncharacterized membrane protein YeaQ/YmgE (transglycosylase-associated protein family)
MMNLIVFVIVGAIAGFLAGKVMTGHGLGLIWDIVVGVLGAFVGRLPVSSVSLRTISSSSAWSPSSVPASCSSCSA